MKKKLFEIANIYTGFTFREGIKHNPDGVYSVIQPSDIIDENIINYDCLSKVNDNFKENNILSDGDVIFKAKGFKNRAYLISSPLENTIATGQFLVIKDINDIIISEYLAWFLNQNKAQVYFDLITAGNKVPNITKQGLAELEIDIPSIQTQEKIVKLFNLQVEEQKLFKELAEKRQKVITAILEKASNEN